MMPSIADEMDIEINGLGPAPEDYWDWISGDDSFFDPETGHALIISLARCDMGEFEFEVRDNHYDECPVILRDTHYFGTNSYESICWAILMFLSEGD